MATALFPGSFDPFTAGHEAVARRVAPLFDRLVVAVGVNSEKHCMFSPEERMERIRRMLADLPNVEVTTYSGMTIDLCHQLGAQFILRGLRNANDFASEPTVAAVNHTLDPAIDTVILLSDTDHQDISSTLERERLAHQNA